MPRLGMCLAAAFAGAAIFVAASSGAQNMIWARWTTWKCTTHMGHGNMKNMALHVTWSDARPPHAADQARGAKLVATVQDALSKNKDYRTAEADGYKPFHPEFKQQRVVHFTNWWYAIKEQFEF